MGALLIPSSRHASILIWSGACLARHVAHTGGAHGLDAVGIVVAAVLVDSVAGLLVLLDLVSLAI